MRRIRPASKSFLFPDRKNPPPIKAMMASGVMRGPVYPISRINGAAGRARYARFACRKTAANGVRPKITGGPAQPVRVRDATRVAGPELTLAATDPSVLTVTVLANDEDPQE